MTVHTIDVTATIQVIDPSSLGSVCGGNETGDDNVDRRLQQRLEEERRARANGQGRVTTDGAQGRKTIFSMRRRGLAPVMNNVYHIGRRAWEALGF